MFEIGFDFKGDWKGLRSFDSFDNAYVYYLENLQKEYQKLNKLSTSLCIWDKDSNIKTFLVEKKEDAWF